MLVAVYQQFRMAYQSHLDGTDRLSQNIIKQLPIYAAYHPRRLQASSGLLPSKDDIYMSILT